MDSAIDPSWIEVLTDPVRLDVLFALGVAGSGTASEVATGCHATEQTVKRHLDALVALGLARESKEGTGSERLGRPPTRFVLDGMVRERTKAMFALLSQPLAP